MKEKNVNQNNYFVKVYNSFMRNNNLSMRDKMVYLYILGFGQCFASQSTMTKDLGISKPTLRLSLKTLEGKGYIEISRNNTIYGIPTMTNLYRCLPIDENTGFPLRHDTTFE